MNDGVGLREVTSRRLQRGADSVRTGGSQRRSGTGMVESTIASMSATLASFALAVPVRGVAAVLVGRGRGAGEGGGPELPRDAAARRGSGGGF